MSIPTQPTPSLPSKSNFISANPLAAGLVKVGQDGIGPGNDRVLDAYFTPDYVFHGPSGDMNASQLKAFWGTMRQALTDFAITRQQVVCEGLMLAARNVFTGTFDHPFENTPLGTIQPTGQPVTIDVINTFRFEPDGRLAEEWAQYDNVAFFKQFGVQLLPPAK